MARSLLILVALALVGSASIAGQDASRPSTAPTAEQRLRIELTVETPVVKAGEPARFKAELVNDGARPVTVVMPGDGSECGWRTPIVRWDPPGQVGARCGNVNALKPDEIVTLGPGRRVALDWIGAPPLITSGRHKVSLELENVPDLEWQGVPLGVHDAVAMKQVRGTSRFKASSNVVTVEVKSAESRAAPVTRPTKRMLEDQKRKDVETIQGLAKAGSALWKPHRLEHHFFCEDRRAAEPVLAWGALRGYERSAIVPRRQKGRDYLSFDLIKNTLPVIANITLETTAMLEVATKYGVSYDGWGCLVVK